MGFAARFNMDISKGHPLPLLMLEQSKAFNESTNGSAAGCGKLMCTSWRNRSMSLYIRGGVSKHFKARQK